MKNVTTFNYNNSEIRTIQKDGETWWVLKDVCEVLGISNSRNVTQRLEKDDVHSMDIIDNLNRLQNTSFINEAALYQVIMLSRKPEAKKFMNWVTHDVLPSIRKHGLYATDALLNDPDLAIKAFSALKQEREQRKRLEEKNANLQNQITQDKPKVVFAEAVSASDDSILIGQLAKILRGNGLDIGQNRLFQILRDRGFLMKHSNMPTQKAMDKGLFKIKETAITHSDGHITVSKTTKVTGHGQVFFVNYFLSKLKVAQ